VVKNFDDIFSCFDTILSCNLDIQLGSVDMLLFNGVCKSCLIGLKYYHVRNDDVRQTTGQPHLLTIVQPQCLSLLATFCESQIKQDAKILTGELEQTTRTSSYYVDEDYLARPEIQQPLPV